ncbi:MAG TPA: aminotransferase class V-fold PLP-dependent enzyme, partial [Actinocrinis sp.]
PGQTWADAVLAALDERVAIVSVPNVHWTDGSLVDLPAVAARARAVGARLVVDASQSVGAMPLDVGALRPDFLITVGYKWLLGPFGVGYMYVAEEHRGGEPLEENWISRAGSQDFARLVDYRDEYQPGARRFDVGQRTKFELVPMAVAALSQVLAWQPANIAAALAGVTARIAEGAAVLGLEPALQRGPHMVGVKVPGELRDAVSRALTDSRCFTAARGDVMRISPHLHITDRDVGTLLGALESAVRSR